MFHLCPTPEAAVAVEAEKIEDVIRPLGLQKKRAHMIQKFSKEYLSEDWSNVRELHGIGKYDEEELAILKLFCLCFNIHVMFSSMKGLYLSLSPYPAFHAIICMIT